MVQINLLPRKRPFFTPGRILLSVIGLGWIAGACIVALTYYSLDEKVVLLEQEIQMKEKAIAMLQKQKTTVQSEDAIDQYLLLSERMQLLFLPTTLLLDELARNLPEQGKLNSIQYSLSGSIQLEGSFEQYDDIAAYQHNLEQSPYVLEADVKNIKSSKIAWQGPVDENGKPLSAALKTAGGKLLPRYIATFEVKAFTVDAKRLAANHSENKADGKPGNKQENSREKKQ